MAKRKVARDRYAVYLNGIHLGFYGDAELLLRSLRKARAEGRLTPNMNIGYNERTKEIHINTSGGRLRRPYIVVEDGKPKLSEEHVEKLKKREMSWNDLVAKGIIEYLDAEEEDSCAYIAQSVDELTPEHTHLEIDPSTIAGIIISCLPYPDHNSSPRLTMAASMMKQSLGWYATNFNYQMNSRAHLMFYPQRPLVQTRAYEGLGFHRRPSGQNFVVAVMSYYGYYMSDVVVVYKAAV